ncbi:hypothetical protein CHELA1G2_10736 [Hyphomicrobiales bacterium]|nr:hypothetical protein CHELA1G2_10736 [Hyphomicrobiales bacterium]
MYSLMARGRLVLPGKTAPPPAQTALYADTRLGLFGRVPQASLYRLGLILLLKSHRWLFEGAG